MLPVCSPCVPGTSERETVSNRLHRLILVIFLLYFKFYLLNEIKGVKYNCYFKFSGRDR